MKRATMVMVLFSAAAILFFSAAPAFAKVKTSGNTAFVSRYIWRGFDLARDDEHAIQGGITVEWPVGVTLNSWGSYALDSDSQMDELDYTVGYSKRLAGPAKVSVGFTHYTFPSVSTAAESQTESNEAYVGVSFPDVKLAPALIIYHDWEDGNGTYYFLSGSTSFKVGGGATPPLNFSFGGGYNASQWTTESEFSDVDFSLSMAFRTGSIDITPSVNYVVTTEDNINDDDELWAAVNFGFGL